MEQQKFPQERLFKKALVHKVLPKLDPPKFEEVLHYTKLGDWLIGVDSTNNYRLIFDKNDKRASSFFSEASKIVLIENELRIDLNRTSLHPDTNNLHSKEMFISLNDYLVSKENLHIYLAQDNRETEFLTLSRESPLGINQLLQIPMYWK